MGRPKTYDRDVIARKAMDLFWLHGFHATSTEALVAHMGVNRFSLYAEFGTKQGLYEAALAIYEREIATRYLGPLEAPDAGLTQVLALIRFFASRAGEPGSEYGCLLCNTATERAAHDVPSAQAFGDYVTRLSSALRHALEGARDRGELRQGVNCADESLFLATSLLGFFVMLRARVAPDRVQAAARAAIDHVEELGAVASREGSRAEAP
jgi:TetR/AcrR family transcriptional repressor of nem operon